MQLPIPNEDRRIRTRLSGRFVNRPYVVFGVVGVTLHDKLKFDSHKAAVVYYLQELIL